MFVIMLYHFNGVSCDPENINESVPALFGPKDVETDAESICFSGTSGVCCLAQVVL